MPNELTVSQQKRRNYIEQGMRQSINKWYEGLCIMHSEELWMGTHSNFGEYAEEEWGIHSRKAYRLVAAGNVRAFLSDQLVTDDEIKESHIREVSDLPPEEAAEVITEAVDTAPKDSRGKRKVTAKHVRETREKSGKAGGGNGRPSPDVKSGRAVDPARVADDLKKMYVAPLTRGLDELAEVNGGKGEWHDAACRGLRMVDEALEQMRGGSQ